MNARGDGERASDTMRRACEAIGNSSLRPQVSAWSLTELAKLVHSRFGVDSAATIFALALETQPGYRGAIEGLADLAYAREEWEKARELYGQIAVDTHPDFCDSRKFTRLGGCRNVSGLRGRVSPCRGSARRGSPVCPRARNSSNG